MGEKAVITAIGKDQVGIVYKVSEILMNNKVNIIDISQKVFSDEVFSMIMMVELPTELNISKLREELNKLSEINIKTFIQGTELFNSIYKL